MGKRSSFERREADFYPTPKAAVLPLIPYLRVAGIKTFAEPCCGEGDLTRHLIGNAFSCVGRWWRPAKGAYDFVSGADSKPVRSSFFNRDWTMVRREIRWLTHAGALPLIETIR